QFTPSWINGTNQRIMEAWETLQETTWRKRSDANGSLKQGVVPQPSSTTTMFQSPNPTLVPLEFGGAFSNLQVRDECAILGRRRFHTRAAELFKTSPNEKKRGSDRQMALIGNL
ncbi:hypothetical protein KUCAC02_004960, partial [Chaenocephalus aceratus]